MALANDFRNGFGAMAGTRSDRRRALVMALAACSAMAAADGLSAAPPHHARRAPLHGETLHESAEMAGEGIYLGGRGVPSPAVAGGHATHDPLWADYGKTRHRHASSGCASCDCAAEAKKPSAFRRAIGSMTSGFDRLIFGSGSKNCGCEAHGGELPCDAMVPDQFHPMPGHLHSTHHQPFTKAAPGRVHLSPLPQAAPAPHAAPRQHDAPGPVPVPRKVGPSAGEPTDPFADDQASRGFDPAAQQSGYFD